jgi:toluene monooxygenase electron transfer component
MARIAIVDSDLSFNSEPDDTLLRAGLRVNLNFPYECNVGSCGTCKFELVSGEIKVLSETAPGLSDRDRKKGRQLACQCIPMGECVIKIRQEEGPPAEFCPARLKAKLIKVTDVTHDIREFQFQAVSPATFIPGQYAMLQLPGVSGERAYSMSNLPNDDGVWSFMIRRVPQGVGTQVLFDGLTLGDEIGIDGPFGKAYFRSESERDLVCVAGGSGLAPMLSIARAWSNKPKGNQERLTFFYGGRESRDICGETMLQQLPEFNQQLQFIPSVSNTGSGEAMNSWKGRTGFIHEVMHGFEGLDYANSDFYIAGPPVMTQSVMDFLRESHAVPQERIYFDRFF